MSSDRENGVEEKWLALTKGFCVDGLRDHDKWENRCAMVFVLLQ